MSRKKNIPSVIRTNGSSNRQNYNHNDCDNRNNSRRRRKRNRQKNIKMNDIEQKEETIQEPVEVTDKDLRILFCVVMLMIIMCALNLALFVWIWLSIRGLNLEINTDFMKIIGLGSANAIVMGVDGSVLSFNKEPLKVIAEVPFKAVSADNKSKAEFRINEQHVTFDGLKHFRITSDKRKLDLINENARVSLPKDFNELRVSAQLEVAGIISAADSSLSLTSNKSTLIKGSRGIRVKGKDISIAADDDVRFNSRNGSTFFISRNFSLNINRLPIVPFDHRPSPNASVQYKLCICIPAGSLFVIQVSPEIDSHVACSFVDMSVTNHPCMLTNDEYDFP